MPREQATASQPLSDLWDALADSDPADPTAAGASASNAILCRTAQAAITARDWELAASLIENGDTHECAQPVGDMAKTPGNTIAHALAFQRMSRMDDPKAYDKVGVLVADAVQGAGLLDVLNGRGMTALAVACSNGNVEFARVLLLTGANPNVPIQRRGQTRYAADFAVDGSCEQRLRHEFEQAGARLATADGPGDRRGSFAARQGHRSFRDPAARPDRSAMGPAKGRGRK